MQENNFKKIFNIENRTKYFTHFLACLLLVSTLTLTLLIIGGKALNKKEKTVAKPDVFALVNLEAKAAVVWDVVNNRELFSKNPDEPLPLASLTKIMTAITTINKINDNQKIKITSENLSPEGDSGLLVGDIWRVGDLRDFTLLTSSNDGAFALAAVAQTNLNNPPNIVSTSTNIQTEFIKKMNDTAVKIGLKNSKFFNANGLDINEGQGGLPATTSLASRAGAYGSARDMVILLQYTLKNYPEILEATRYKNLEFESAYNCYHAENTNVVVDQIPGILASKTGYTDLAGGNLVIAFDAGLGRPIVISVLGSSSDGRFSDVLSLVSSTLKQLPNL